MNRDVKEKKSIEEETIEELMDLRGYLEQRIKKLEEESEKLKALFTIVDEVVLAKSFKKAEAISISIPEKPTVPKYIEEIPLKNSTGVLLATMYIGEEEARILPAETLTFTVNTPPFQTFLVSRILEPMRTKDIESSQKGIIVPDHVLSYEIIVEGDIIKQLIVRNYGTRRRLREIISSSRWTFDKMNEKIRTPNNTI